MVTSDDAVGGFVPNVPVIPVGQLDAARVTAELKPLAGIIVTVDVPVDPTIAVAAVAPIVKLGAALRVSERVVLADELPLVPFTVSVYGPGATPEPTVIVTTEDAVAGFVPNVPVMPVGQLDGASV